MSDFEDSVEAACQAEMLSSNVVWVESFLHTQVLDSAAQEYNCYSFMMK